MIGQSNYLGYQPSNTERALAEQNEEQNSNELLTWLGGGSLASGLAIAGDITQRAKSGSGKITTESLSKAASEFGLDLRTALSVISGRSEYDRAMEGHTTKAANIRDYARSGKSEYLNIEFPDDRSGIDEILSERTQGKPSYRKNRLTQAAVAARDAFQPSSEDFIAAKREDNRRRGRNPEGPRAETAVTRMPLVDAAKELLYKHHLPGGFSEEQMIVRRDKGLDLLQNNAHQQVGSVLGRGASDFINNGVRSFWWLVNAPQAVSDLVSESATGVANREGLYGSDIENYQGAVTRGWYDDVADEVIDRNVRVRRPNILADDVDLDTLRLYLDKYEGAAALRQADLADLRELQAEFPNDESLIANERKKRLNRRTEVTDPTTGARKFEPVYRPLYSRRRTNNNLSTALALPAAVAINAGLGLVSPFGGTEGRKAVFPSDEDPTKTDNVLAEVAAKYFLGRTGDLLPWEEFKKVRPDVSKGDYMSYKGYRYGKEFDINPFDDGKTNIFNGVLKTNADGIDGAEIQFLGKSLPVNSNLIPTSFAIGGAALGAALGKHGILNQTRLENDKKEIDSLKNFLGDFGSADDRVYEEAMQRGTKSRDAKFNDLGDVSNDSVKRQIDAMRSNLRGKEKQVARREPIINAPGMRSITNRLRRTNPVVSGLVGGGVALAGGALIGNELERRRREGKIQERQERGY